MNANPTYTDEQLLRTHAVCTYLRGKQCDRCPRFSEYVYGKAMRGCFALANEICNIAQHGNPWGKNGDDASVVRWRTIFNDLSNFQ